MPGQARGNTRNQQPEAQLAALLLTGCEQPLSAQASEPPARQPAWTRRCRTRGPVTTQLTGLVGPAATARPWLTTGRTGQGRLRGRSLVIDTATPGGRLIFHKVGSCRLDQGQVIHTGARRLCDTSQLHVDYTAEMGPQPASYGRAGPAAAPKTGRDRYPKPETRTLTVGEPWVNRDTVQLGCLRGVGR